MPLFRRSAPKEDPPVMPGLAAYELGVWHALDGRAPLTRRRLRGTQPRTDAIPNRWRDT